MVRYASPLKDPSGSQRNEAKRPRFQSTNATDFGTSVLCVSSLIFFSVVRFPPVGAPQWLKSWLGAASCRLLQSCFLLSVSFLLDYRTERSVSSLGPSLLRSPE